MKPINPLLSRWLGRSPLRTARTLPGVLHVIHPDNRRREDTALSQAALPRNKRRAPDGVGIPTRQARPLATTRLPKNNRALLGI